MNSKAILWEKVDLAEYGSWTPVLDSMNSKAILIGQMISDNYKNTKKTGCHA